MTEGSSKVDSACSKTFSDDDIEDLSDEHCRICYGEEESDDKLISPCLCKGSVKYIHEKCLKYWRCHGKEYNTINQCEQCNSEYSVKGDVRLSGKAVHTISLILLLVAYGVSFLFTRVIYCVYSAIIEDLLALSSPMPVYVYHSACILLFLTFFIIYNNESLFGAFNYVFTYWRIIQYNFLLDRIIYAGFTSYYLIKLFDYIKKGVLALSYYQMNKDYL